MMLSPSPVHTRSSMFPAAAAHWRPLARAAPNRRPRAVQRVGRRSCASGHNVVCVAGPDCSTHQPQQQQQPQPRHHHLAPRVVAVAACALAAALIAPHAAQAAAAAAAAAAAGEGSSSLVQSERQLGSQCTRALSPLCAAVRVTPTSAPVRTDVTRCSGAQLHPAPGQAPVSHDSAARHRHVRHLVVSSLAWRGHWTLQAVSGRDGYSHAADARAQDDCVLRDRPRADALPAWRFAAVCSRRVCRSVCLPGSPLPCRVSTR
jgi:hypothetical protein